MSNSQHQYVIEPQASGQQTTGKPQRVGRATQTGGSGTFEEEPSLGEVLNYVFGIGVRERTLYAVLLENGPSTVRELVTALEWQRSRGSRGLKRLHKRGLVTRRRRIISSGGHVYEYTALPPERVTQLLCAGFEEWARMANESLREFGADTG